MGSLWYRYRESSRVNGQPCDNEEEKPENDQIAGCPRVT